MVTERSRLFQSLSELKEALLLTIHGADKLDTRIIDNGNTAVITGLNEGVARLL